MRQPEAEGAATPEANEEQGSADADQQWASNGWYGSDWRPATEVGAWKKGRWHGPKWWTKRVERQQRYAAYYEWAQESDNGVASTNAEHDEAEQGWEADGAWSDHDEAE
eukprot:9431642-Alexandrium_andersonii.AAC.1